MVRCYFKNDANPNLIRPVNAGVCMGSGSSTGGFSCCSPSDICLPSGICYGPRPNSTTNSIYYAYSTAMCTDQTLQDPACQKGCNGLYRTGLQYNTTNNLWTCCDAGNPLCSTSANLTFKAAAPDVLQQSTGTLVDFIPSATPSAPSIASTISTSTTAGLSSSTALSQSTTSSTSQSDSPSISTGAIVGISIAGTLIAIAVVVGIILFFLKKRKRTIGAKRPGYGISGPTSQWRPHRELNSYMPVEKSSRNIVEAPNAYPYDNVADPNTQNDRYGTQAVEAPDTYPSRNNSVGHAHANHRGLHELS